MLLFQRSRVLPLKVQVVEFVFVIYEREKVSFQDEKLLKITCICNQTLRRLLPLLIYIFFNKIQSIRFSRLSLNRLCHDFKVCEVTHFENGRHGSRKPLLIRTMIPKPKTVSPKIFHKEQFIPNAFILQSQPGINCEIFSRTCEFSKLYFFIATHLFQVLDQ